VKTSEFGSFFRAVGLVFVLLVGASWVWAARGPMWFLDPEYPMWVAKNEMISECRKDATVIIGDSRAVAGLIPAHLDPSTVNLALGGATPVETYYVAQRILKCPDLPRKVILSISPYHFATADSYWTRAALFSFLSFSEMEEVRKLSESLHDKSLYSVSRTGSIEDRLTNFLYASHFPAFYTGSMKAGMVYRRKHTNDEWLDEVKRQRGYHSFGTDDGSTALSFEVTAMSGFHSRPIFDAYFDRLLTLFADKGIEVNFVPMPMSDLSYKGLPAGFRQDYTAYIDGFRQRHPNFHVTGDLIPVLPWKYFGDRNHLNRAGAEVWTGTVARTLGINVQVATQ
jgi:hypothetical protein